MRMDDARVGWRIAQAVQEAGHAVDALRLRNTLGLRNTDEQEVGDAMRRFHKHGVQFAHIMHLLRQDRMISRGIQRQGIPQQSHVAALELEVHVLQQLLHLLQQSH